MSARGPGRPMAACSADGAGAKSVVMRHPVSSCLRAERRAGPKPAQAGSEPRHSLPSGDRPAYPTDEGPS